MTRATTFRATAIIGGVLLAILMIMTVSRAAFSDETSNDANSVAAGSVVLYNNAPGGGWNLAPGDETGAAMFGAWDGSWMVKANDLTPGGDPVDHCIEIIYDGSIDANVSLDSITSGTPSVGGFRAQVTVNIQRFANSTSCENPEVSGTTVADGTLAVPGLTTDDWSTISVTSQFYRVTLGLHSDADNGYQGATINDINFEWLAAQA